MRPFEQGPGQEAEASNDQARGRPRVCAFRELADRESPLNAGENGPERIFGAEIGLFEVHAVAHDPCERKPGRCGGVGERGVTTSGVPTKEPFRGQSEASKMVYPLVQNDLGRRGLKDLGASVFVEDLLGAPQMVRIGLAIVAHAHQPVPGARVDGGRGAAEGAARAFQRDLHSWRLD